MRLEVGWSANHCHADVRSDAHGDHVLRHLLAAANAGVEALVDDVGQAVVDDDLDLDVGILAQERHEFGPEDRVGDIVDGRDAGSCRRACRGTRSSAASSVSISSKRGPIVCRSRSPASRGRDAARGARQEPNAEPRFEFAHRVAERRLRHAELGRRPGETPLPGHGQEGQKVVEIAALHLWLQLIGTCRL